MVGYVLRPCPDKVYISASRLFIAALRVGGVGRFRAKGRGHLPALPVVSRWQNRNHNCGPPSPKV